MKFLLISFLVVFSFMVVAASVSAQTIEIPNPIGAGTIPELVDKIATWLLEIGSTIAVIIVLYAAFLFMTAGGNKERVTSARKTLLYAIIGLTVLLLAKGVSSIVTSFLSGQF